MSDAPAKSTGRGMKVLLKVVRWILVCVVLAAVGRHIHSLLGKMGDAPVVLSAPWLVAAALLYAVGMCAFAMFWRSCLLDMSGESISIGRALSAYWPSQLGKYVPGKAWVVVVRCWVLGERVSAFPAASSSAYETLLVMAVGACVALSLLLATRAEIDPRLLALSGGLMLCLATVSAPRVFRRLTRLVAAPFRRGAPSELPACSQATIGRGIGAVAFGWLLLGASMWAVVRGASGVEVSPSLLPTMVGTAALAVVCGFVAFLVPGGLGIREYFLIQALGPVIGEPQAALVAVVGRLVWVLTEAVMASGSLLWVKLRR